MFVYLGIVVGGAYLAFDNVPSLKANILEMVNPRVQEAKLVDQLDTTLTELESATTPAQRNILITKSQELLKGIATINTAHSGVVAGIVTKVTDALTRTATSPTATSPASPVGATMTPATTPCAP